MNPPRFIANSTPDALNPSVGIFSARSKRLNVRSVSFATNLACSRRVRFTLNTGPRRNEWARQFRAKSRRWLPTSNYNFRVFPNRG